MPRLACPALQITYTGQEKCLPAISSQDPAVRAARQQITAILQQNAQLPEQLCSDFSAQFGELAAVDEIEFLQVTDMLAIAPWQQCQACWSCLPSCTAAAAFALRTQRPPVSGCWCVYSRCCRLCELLPWSSKASSEPRNKDGALQGWAAANHSLEETDAEIRRLAALAQAAQSAATPRVSFCLYQVSGPVPRHALL